ncbi:MAG: HAMP domain-containing protein [Alteromonadaceae bacterium]|nr:HAMP domain-containing protein [Alteromonadaceae bacterium]
MNKLKLKQLLLIAMISVGMAPLIIAALISTNKAAVSLERQVFAQLQSIRQVKGEAIERHFEDSLSIINTTSESPITQDAAMQLKTGFIDYVADSGVQGSIDTLRNELSRYYQKDFAQKYNNINGVQLDATSLYESLSPAAVALQHAYIYDNPAPLGAKDELFEATGSASYHHAHKQFHGYFRQILLEFGYYDIFLVDPETGVVFYSVFKELDYATSLLTGPYANSNFAEVFKLSVKNQSIHTADFKRYQPSYEAPASFQAAPVKVDGRLEAILVFQLPIEPINEIMASRAGMGNTGETYLVGEDRLMRSDSYLQPSTHSVSASFANPQVGRVDTEAVNQALKGKPGTRIITDYLGNPVLSSFAELKLGDFSWVILAEMDEAEAFAPVSELRHAVVIILLLSGIVIVFTALFIAKQIAQPIHHIAVKMKEVERSGDFSVLIGNHSSNEIGTISKAFDSLLSGLKKSFSHTKNILGEVAKGNYDQEVSGDYKGDLLDLKQGINTAIVAVRNANAESIKQGEIAKEQAAQAAMAKTEAESQKLNAIAKAEEAANQQNLAQQASATAEQKALEAEKASEEASKQKLIAEQKADEAEAVATKAKRDALSSLRIKQALDNVSTGAIVCDNQQVVIYCNKAMESYLAKLATLESVNLEGKPAYSLFEDEDIISYIKSTDKSTETPVSTSLGDYYYNVAINKIYDEQRQLMGTVIELTDRTEEVATEREIEQLVRAATSGDLTARVEESGKQGFFLDLAKGLNELLSISDLVIDESGQVFGALASGNLSKTMQGDFRGSFGQLQKDANSTIEKLRDVISEIAESADRIETNSRDITAGNSQISNRTQSLAAALEESAASMEEMTATVQGSARNAGDASRTADEASAFAQQGGEICDQAINSMQAIEDSSKQISDIIGVIDEIAFQTNLLALNASVEAARAGEQGRGFAVVAGEVRNLAQRAAVAAKEIKDLITESVTKVEAGTGFVNQSGESLRQIIGAVRSVNEAISEIASASDQQVTGIQQINATINSMEENTQQTAAFTEEAASSVEKMEAESIKMKEQIAFFSIG